MPLFGRVRWCATWLVAAAVMAPLYAANTSHDDANAQNKPQTMTRAEVTAIIANSRRIVTPNGVDEMVKVPINGIDQWLSIRGKDRRNPILLMLHGGPASPSMPDDYTYQSSWEDYFTVVQWDQRGAGKTYAANSEQNMAPGMTIEGMTDDAAQVVQYLREHYHKQKIFVLGHSWGTVLGTRLAQQHPDWLYAYIGVGQVVNVRRNEEIGYGFALREAQASGNAKALAELKGIAPYPGTAPLTLDRLGVRSKWEMFYGGLAFGRQNYSFDSDAETLSPDYSQQELDAIDKGSAFTIHHLMASVIDVDFDNTTHFKCPVILFVGAHDETTSHELAEQWFDKLQAPSKRLVIFADAAHMVMQEQPGRFLTHLVNDALPLAQAAGDAAPAEVSRDR
ncbi:alpha/beta hydrolase [Dyella sp. 2HG41-7]|uniref:alpha/beta fold hydrolase n=1 Tax=Dyella sp. 2HG41-7 TaxID=2883239 RepID=UPI001F24E9C0|nr:alpha/beta hydrolase [Dyella sp. 2HG41-7]